MSFLLPAPGLSLETGGGRGPSPGTGTIKPLDPSHDQGGMSLSVFSCCRKRWIWYEAPSCTDTDLCTSPPPPPPAAPGRLTESKEASVASKGSRRWTLVPFLCHSEALKEFIMAAVVNLCLFVSFCFLNNHSFLESLRLTRRWFFSNTELVCTGLLQQPWKHGATQHSSLSV